MADYASDHGYTDRAFQGGNNGRHGLWCAGPQRTKACAGDGAAGSGGHSGGEWAGFAQSAWYFAEGYTSPTFREWYYVANPSGAPVNATLTFYRSDGTLATVSASVAAGAQWVVDANAVLGSVQVNNSAALTASAPVLAERVMSFTYIGGVGSGSSASNALIPGGSDVLGTNAPGTLFDFAEGYTGGQFAEYLTLENPATTTATVTVTYLPSDGSTPVIRTYMVPATSRATISTNQVMSQSFSMQIVANQPIVAERPMYFVYTGSNRTQTGGTDIVGYQQ